MGHSRGAAGNDGQPRRHAGAYGARARGSPRPDLARLWGLAGYEAISRGVYTPAGQNLIILFVTREKQNCLTQYQDFLQDDILFWEGEKGHGSDDRIARASQTGEEPHLFYRERHHSPFTYHGKVIMLQCVRNNDRPSEFRFNVVSLAASLAPDESMQVAEEPADYADVMGATSDGTGHWLEEDPQVGGDVWCRFTKLRRSRLETVFSLTDD